MKNLTCVTLPFCHCRSEALKRLAYCPVWDVPPPGFISLLVDFFSLDPPTTATSFCGKLEVVSGAGLLTLALLTFGAGWFLVAGPHVPCWTFSSILGLDPLIPVASPSPVVTTKNISRRCQTSSGGDKIVSGWAPPGPTFALWILPSLFREGL